MKQMIPKAVTCPVVYAAEEPTEKKLQAILYITSKFHF